MDAEKVKELINNDIEAHSDGYARRLLKGVLQQLKDFEAAEQEGWKGLPLCGGRTMIRIEEENPGFPCPQDHKNCKHSRWSKPAGWRCAHPFDEPAEGSESVLTTKEAIRVLDTRTFEERFEEIEKSYWKRMEQTLKRLNELEINAINVGMLEARIDSRIDTLEATDTSFRATLKGYLVQLDNLERRHTSLFAELGDHLHEHGAQADDQQEEAEREAGQS